MKEKLLRYTLVLCSDWKKNLKRTKANEVIDKQPAHEAGALSVLRPDIAVALGNGLSVAVYSNYFRMSIT
jgi:hypothetical protein